MKILYLNFQTSTRFLMIIINGYAYGEEPLLLRGIVLMEAEGYASISSAHDQSGWLNWPWINSVANPMRRPQMRTNHCRLHKSQAISR